jgi:hypothetical protein
MKTKFALTMILAVLALSAFAQKLEMSKKLTRDEVPVTIILAFQKDFPTLTGIEGGIWKLYYQHDLKTQKFIPRLYEFTFKKDGERVEINYKPDGKFDHAKGIDPPTIVSQL